MKLSLLATLEKNLHSLIMGNDYVKSGELVTKSKQKLPQIMQLLGWEDRLWFPIAGMYGGYGIELATEEAMRQMLEKELETDEKCKMLFQGEKPEEGFGLICDSFVRVWGGSEQDHFITQRGVFSRLQPYN